MNKQFSLKNKNIILTGAAGIIGQKLSQEFLNAGANLALLDLDSVSLTKLKSKLYSKESNYFEIYEVDLTNEIKVNKLVDIISQRFGTIDVLHNNAASKGRSTEDFLKPFEEYKLSTWNDVMDANLSSMFLMTKAVGSIMKKQNYGNIIQTASIYGVVTPDKEIYKNSYYNGLEISSPASYSVSKAGVIALTKYLASYWAKYNIRVNSISPGGIFSGQNESFVQKYSSKVPLGRMATENDIVGAAIFLSSDASSYITGQNILVDGGFTL
jgi:NAD(P)-dependent dehydrogenase (short-subunit alcohol dehydrogenase family)